MRMITIIIIGCLITSLSLAKDDSPQTVFQLCQVFEKASADTQEMTFEARSNESKISSVEKLFVRKLPVVDDSGVKTATPDTIKATGEAKVYLVFNEATKKSWAQFTREHIGERIATVIHGKVFSVKKIEGEIRWGQIWLGGMTNLNQANQIASDIMSAVNARATTQR